MNGKTTATLMSKFRYWTTTQLLKIILLSLHMATSFNNPQSVKVAHIPLRPPTIKILTPTHFPRATSNNSTLNSNTPKLLMDITMGTNTRITKGCLILIQALSSTLKISRKSTSMIKKTKKWQLI